MRPYSPQVGSSPAKYLSHSFRPSFSETPITVTPSSDSMRLTFVVSQIRTSQGSTRPSVTLPTSISSYRAAPPDPDDCSWRTPGSKTATPLVTFSVSRRTPGSKTATPLVPFSVSVPVLLLLVSSSLLSRTLMYSRRYSSNNSLNFSGFSSRMAWSSSSSNLLFFTSASTLSPFSVVFSPSSSSSVFLFTLSCSRTLAFLIRMSVPNSFSIRSRHACEWGCKCNPRRIAEHPGHLSV